MSTFIHIFVNIILPVFLLMGVGAAMDRIFRLDMSTLSKLNFYVFVPVLLFVKLLDSRLSATMMATVVGFSFVHLSILFVLSWILFGVDEFREHRPLLSLGALFNNCGNYGLPVAAIAFGNLGVEVMAIVIVFQNVTSFALGLYLLGDKSGGSWKRILAVLKTPVLCAVVLAPICGILDSRFGLKLPYTVRFPLDQIANGMIPIALITLGAQLSRTQWFGQVKSLTAVTAMRLLVSPALAAVLAWAWERRFPGQGTQALPILVCSAGLPVAVNVYILAMECKREPELASRMVFWSTFLSGLTMTIWLSIFGR
jgi:malate permease and related proteins